MGDSTPQNPVEPPVPTAADELRPALSERWLMVVGASFALGMMGILGYLVIRPTPVPCSNRQFFVAFFALGCACASSFLGGYVAYRGKVGNAGAISVGGGILVLLVVLSLGNRYWSGGSCSDPLPPVSVVWGTISGLTTDVDAWPDELGDYFTYERTHRRTDHFDWIIRFTMRPVPVRFAFQRKSPAPKLDSQLQFLGGSHAEAAPPPLELRFDLPAAPAPIFLEYREPPGSGADGMLYWRNGAASTAVPWVKASNLAAPAVTPRDGILARAFSLLRPLGVYAADGDPCAAKTGASPDELLEQLSTSDLARQINARNRLIKAGDACVSFIAGALKNPPAAKGSQHGVLISNLATVVDGLSAQKVKIPGEAYADLATSEYALGQFDRAARYFTHVDSAALQKNPNWIYYKGYSQSKTGKPQEAIDSYHQFEKVAKPDAQTSGLVHTSIGMALYDLGKAKDQSGDLKGASDLYTQSTQELQKVVQTNPRIQAAKPQLEISRKAAETAKTKLNAK